MLASIVQIGNSKGLRLPKSVIDSCGFEDEVELHVRAQSLVIKPARRPREGWAEIFEAGSKSGSQTLLDDETATEWDKKEWKW